MLRYGASRCRLNASCFRPIAVQVEAQTSAPEGRFAANSTDPRLLQNRIRYRLYSQTTLAMPKRKSVSKATNEPAFTLAPIPIPNFEEDSAPPLKRRASQRKVSQPKPNTGSTNPDKNANVLDGPGALRASPDASEPDERLNVAEAGMDVDKQVKDEDEDDSPLSDLPESQPEPRTKKAKPRARANATSKKEVTDEAKSKPAPATKEKKEASKVPQFLNPEAEGDEEADEEEIQAALSRPPPVHSDYLPLPWKGRLGYVSTPLLQLFEYADYHRHV